MTEKEYRALPYDSYSSIKDFIDDRKKYHKRWILGEPVKEELSKALIMGLLTETLLDAPKEFDDKFSLSMSSEPTGQMGEFTKALYRKSLDHVDMGGNLTADIGALMKEAYDYVKYDGKGEAVAFKRKTYDQVVEDFLGSEAESYYRQLMNSIGKVTVEHYEIQNAERVGAGLRTNWVTRDVVNVVSSKEVDVHKQLAIIFEFKGYKLKSLIDKLIVDHRIKKIFIYDLKTCWDNEKEFQTNWFKYKYYLQAAVYYLAVLWWADKEGWKEYEIVPMQFIVADTTNYQNPLIYQTDSVNLQQGIDGFYLRGKYYPGILKAIEDLKWHRENSLWDISQENHNNKGLVKIKPFIEDEY